MELRTIWEGSSMELIWNMEWNEDKWDIAGRDL